MILVAKQRVAQPCRCGSDQLGHGERGGRTRQERVDSSTLATCLREQLTGALAGSCAAARPASAVSETTAVGVFMLEVGTDEVEDGEAEGGRRAWRRLLGSDWLQQCVAEQGKEERQRSRSLVRTDPFWESGKHDEGDLTSSSTWRRSLRPSYASAYHLPAYLRSGRYHAQQGRVQVTFRPDRCFRVQSACVAVGTCWHEHRARQDTRPLRFGDWPLPVSPADDSSRWRG